MIQDKKKALGRGLESLLPSRPQAAPAAAPKAGAEPEPMSAGEAEIMTADKAPTITEAAHLTVDVIQAVAESIKNRPGQHLIDKIRMGEMVVQIPLDLLARNPYQTRFTSPDDPGLKELMDSIQAHGVMQPAVVRPLSRPGPNGELYHIVAGERRWMASRAAGKTHLPATIRQMTDSEAMVLTIVENLHRQDLNPMQHARAVYRLLEQFRLTQEEVAIRLGMTRSSVANYIRLTRLPEFVQNSIEEGKLTFGHAKVLLPLVSSDSLEICARKVLHGRMSVRETEQLVEEFLHPSAPRPKEERRVDANVKAAEEELARSLGCRVRIKDRNGRGRIEIEYRTLEDFDRVVGALK